jgi:hypothetical protein
MVLKYPLKMHETHSIKIMQKSTCLSQLHFQNAEHLPKVIKRTFLLNFHTKTNIEGNKHSMPKYPSFIFGGSCVKYIFRSINDQPFINFH